MTRKELQDLFDKYLDGKATKEEKQLLKKFDAEFQNPELWDEKLGDKSAFRDELWQKVEEETARREKDENFNTPPNGWKVWRVAASITLICGASLLGYLFYTNSGPWQTASDQLLTKTTIAGQKSTITLADGTTIRLNSESTLTYPESFDGNVRSIQLVGEAFFDVARDEKRPFIIKSGDLVTTVLGTSFNVSAFPDEDIEVTVATGKVSVSTNSPFEAATDVGGEGDVSPPNLGGAGGGSQLLLPGDQATFNPETKSLTKQQVEIESFLAWTNNEIYFEKKSLAEAMDDLERWYGADISFETDAAKTCVIESARFKDENLNTILKTLGFLLDFEYEIRERNQVIISGKGCQ